MQSHNRWSKITSTQMPALVETMEMSTEVLAIAEAHCKDNGGKFSKDDCDILRLFASTCFEVSCSYSLRLINDCLLSIL